MIYEQVHRVCVVHCERKQMLTVEAVHGGGGGSVV